jgi:hypothetical protein
MGLNIPIKIKNGEIIKIFLSTARNGILPDVRRNTGYIKNGISFVISYLELETTNIINMRVTNNLVRGSSRCINVSL